MVNVLETKELSISFGGLKAIDSIDLDVAENQIVALIGPNGAGKTSFFNCISGIYKASQGHIYLNAPGKEKVCLDGLESYKITRLGIGRTFQNIRLFRQMTVLQNVIVGRYCRATSFFWNDTPRSGRTNRSAGHAAKIIENLGLSDYSDQLAGNLPFAYQRRLELARALATEPMLLLLDEPAAGLNPKETQELEELILTIQKENQVSILLIEHDMKFVMRISNKIMVMDQGKKIAEGAPEQIQKDEKVIHAYLGEE